MSYEYHGTLSPFIKIDLSELVNRSNIESLAAAMPSHDGTLILRWTGFPVRSQWPEDITIAQDTRGLLVLFHTGNSAIHAQVLERLSKAILEITGQIVEFFET